MKFLRDVVKTVGALVYFLITALAAIWAMAALMWGGTWLITGEADAFLFLTGWVALVVFAVLVQIAMRIWEL